MISEAEDKKIQLLFEAAHEMIEILEPYFRGTPGEKNVYRWKQIILGIEQL